MNREGESVKLRKWEFWGKNMGVVGRRAMPALLVPASSRRLGDDTDRPPGTTLGSGERGVGLPGQVPINHPPLYISAPLFTTLLFCPPSSSSTIRITPPLCGKILDNTYKAWMRDDILKEMNVYFNF